MSSSLLSEYYRIAVAWVDRSLVGSGLHQKHGQPFGAAAHVFPVFFLCADGWDPQQRKQFLEEPPYHAYWKGNGYKGRCMNLDRVYWSKDGWPYFKEGIPSVKSEMPIIRKTK